MELQLDAQRIYIDTGGESFDVSRPVVVFIHGAQQDHSAWHLLSREFARNGFSVLAVDLPGHGRSHGAPLPTIEAQADWIAALLTEVGAGDTAICLVGHSMGSLAALECAARHPQTIRQLALLGTSVPMPVSSSLLETAQNDEQAAMQMINTWSYSTDNEHSRTSAPAQRAANLRLMESQRPGVLPTDLGACHAYANGIAAAAAIRCPTLIISGSADLMTKSKAAARLASSIAGSRHIDLPGAGHALMDDAAQAVLEALLEFIQ